MGKPVITSHQALLWRCLNTLNIGQRLAGFGRAQYGLEMTATWAPNQGMPIYQHILKPQTLSATRITLAKTGFPTPVAAENLLETA